MMRIFCGAYVLLLMSGVCAEYSRAAAITKPNNLMVFPTGDSLLHAKISWSDRSDNEDGFALERRNGSDGSWEEIARTDTTFYIDGPLVLGDTCYYRVRAYNDTEYSDYSMDDYLVVLGTPWVRVTQPTGSIQIRPNDTLWIQWTCNRIGLVAIHASFDNGISWPEITETGGVGNASEAWQNYPFVIPDSLLDMTIKIKVRKYESQSVYGLSGDISVVEELSIALRPGFAVRDQNISIPDARIREMVRNGTAVLIRPNGSMVSAEAIQPGTKPRGFYLLKTATQIQPYVFTR